VCVCVCVCVGSAPTSILHEGLLHPYQRRLLDQPQARRTAR
jgi:hypothetical protein